jgi:hypothetical protein
MPLISITLDCRLSQFSATTANSGIRLNFLLQLPTLELNSFLLTATGNYLNSNSSCVRSSWNNIGTDPQKTPLFLLLRVESLLQRCVVYSCAATSAALTTENAFTIIAWRHSIYDAFLCCLCKGHCLATAVSLPPQFLLWANTPQYTWVI